jgi:hypothetical protein
MGLDWENASWMNRSITFEALLPVFFRRLMVSLESLRWIGDGFGWIVVCFAFYRVFLFLFSLVRQMESAAISLMGYREAGR